LGVPGLVLPLPARLAWAGRRRPSTVLRRAAAKPGPSARASDGPLILVFFTSISTMKVNTKVKLEVRICTSPFIMVKKRFFFINSLYTICLFMLLLYIILIHNGTRASSSSELKRYIEEFSFIFNIVIILYII
jgi:hypothetical protein